MEKFNFIEYFDAPTVLLNSDGQILKSNSHFVKQPELSSHVSDNKIKLESTSESTNWKIAFDFCLKNGFSEFEFKKLKMKAFLSSVKMDSTSVVVHFFDAAKSIGFQLPQETQQQKEFTEIGSAIAHAINNPLTVIKTRTQMLKFLYDSKKPVTEEMVLQLLEKVESQADRVKYVVEVLRGLVKFPPPEDYVDVDLFSLLSDVRLALEPQLKEKNISYEFKSEVGQKWAHCKAEELTDIFKSLLTNSIEAFQVAGTVSPKIEVLFKEDDENLHFYFSDNGPGINSENYPKIFKPFFTTKTNNAATCGVGLSVSRKFAKSYGGQLVNVDASPGHCSFHLSLPKARLLTLGSNPIKEQLKKSS